MDELHHELLTTVERGQSEGRSRREIFSDVWEAAHAASGAERPPVLADVGDPTTIPYFTEPWFC